MVSRALSFRKELSKESDRGCALLASAYLDDQVRELLARVVVDSPPTSIDVFEGTAPLASFSARIDIAFLFGLVGAAARRDLHLVRKIRNDFAHDPVSLDFTASPIASRCRELQHRLHAGPRPPRGMFTEAVMGLLAVLHGAIREARHLASPPDLDLTAARAKGLSTEGQLMDKLLALAEHDEDAPMRVLKESLLEALRAAEAREADERGKTGGGASGGGAAPGGER